MVSARGLVTVMLMMGPVLLHSEGAPTTFRIPEEARDALVKAAGVSLDAVRDIFGPGADEILRTGDPIQDQIALENFKERAKQKITLEIDATRLNRATLLLGNIDWPFPVPLVRNSAGWYFDIKEGAKELRNRIIGANELDAIEICEGYVEAQRKYAEVDRNGSGIPQYARKVNSSPGKKDGLYWPHDPDSPIVGLISRAIAEGYSAPSEKRQVYHGYYYKILTSQGSAAIGGARDFLVGELMIGGFALVAWPAEHGVSGFKTFIVNQDGVVYEKDLGATTSAEVEAMVSFDPNESWDIAPQVSWEPLDE